VTPNFLLMPPTLLATFFERPGLLALALVLPVIVALLLLRRHRNVQMRVARLGTASTVARLLPPRLPIGWRARSIMLGTAGVCAGVAFAGPRWGSERTEIATSGADVVIAIDASLSMLATDEPPTRLERVKEEIRRLRYLSPGDRVALLAFAGRSYILTPLTVDDGALDLFLDNLDPSVVGQPGTSLARAIRQGTDLLLTTKTASDRAIVLMSDGEGFESEDDVRREAARAAENGISLVTVGFGTERGTTIPIPNATGTGITAKRDENGEIVITHYTPSLLRAAADAAHGTFIAAPETDKASNIRRALAKLRVARRAIERGEELSQRFQLFLLPAVLLILADTLLAEGRVRRPRVATPAVPPGQADPAVRAPAPRRAAVAAIAPIAFLAAAANGFVPASPPDSTGLLADYRHVVDAGDHSPPALYNYGTALLDADSIDGAISALTLAATTRDGELRYRALFNLGLAHLRRGLAARAAKQSGDQELDAALDTYKHVLLSRPGDHDATWNYELALHRHDAGGGGGGGRSTRQQRASSSQRRGPAPEQSGTLGQNEARELLNSAAREERDVQGKSQRQNATEVPPGGKDW
jgi:Ca-activated chloride channel family protein